MAAGAVTAVAAAGVGARAQVTIPPILSTTTTTAAPAPTPTSAPPAKPGPPAPPPGSGKPAPPPPAGPPGSPPGPPPASAGDSPDGPPGAPRVVPPGAQAAIDAVKRTPANSTKKLVEALRPLQNLGLTEEEAIQIGFGRFPVGGPATFTDDWLFPRFTPSFHLHQGTDVFAGLGTPVRSPVDGTLRHSNGAVGGLAAYVHEPNGTFYYLAHLRGFAPGQSSGRRVKVGEVIGYNGDSGNARGGPPHVHFEVHPRGGGAVNPKPFLDRWLGEALAAVPALIESLEASRPRALVATGLTRRLADGGGAAFAAPVGPSQAQLLWASSASPVGGALRLAEAAAAGVAREVDWAAEARRQQAAADARRASEARAREVLGPLTPPGLRPVLGLR